MLMQIHRNPKLFSKIPAQPSAPIQETSRAVEELDQVLTNINLILIRNYGPYEYKSRS